MSYRTEHALAFGAKIRELRVKAQLSQEEVGRQIGYSVSYISDLETGKRGPLEPEAISELASVLHANTKQKKELQDAAGWCCACYGTGWAQ
jgi:transcriptional regulator with XRE-family HTH domain